MSEAKAVCVCTALCDLLDLPITLPRLLFCREGRRAGDAPAGNVQGLTIKRSAFPLIRLFSDFQLFWQIFSLHVICSWHLLLLSHAFKCHILFCNIKTQRIIDFQGFWREYDFSQKMMWPHTFMRERKKKNNFVSHLSFQGMQAVAWVHFVYSSVFWRPLFLLLGADLRFLTAEYPWKWYI